jgi:hypothetical protein
MTLKRTTRVTIDINDCAVGITGQIDALEQFDLGQLFSDFCL